MNNRHFLTDKILVFTTNEILVDLTNKIWSRFWLRKVFEKQTIAHIYDQIYLLYKVTQQYHYGYSGSLIVYKKSCVTYMIPFLV